MSNLAQRIIFAVIGAALLLGCVWYSAWTFAVLFAAIQAKMLLEFYRMMRAAGYRPAKWIGLGAGVYLFAVVAVLKFVLLINLDSINFATSIGRAPGWHTLILPSSSFVWILGLFLVLPVWLLIGEMRRWPQTTTPFGNVGATLLGLLYVSLPMSLLSLIAGETSYDPRRVLALLLLVWSSDIGAYAAGKTFGKHKLAPSISPGKTWEGTIGGFLLTLGMGWALGYLLPELSLTYRLVVAGVVAVFGPLGDLAESMLKRSVDVKDSGRIMPGHGGLLDRFDAFLFILPVLALLQLLVG
ncbi:phosphatidate cytidylyltransferase [Hymenobacter weizhouensis]|nr:phosphatidate cytidylyltransferase [Hymenobacter sp. YIM 151500-1]